MRAPILPSPLPSSPTLPHTAQQQLLPTGVGTLGPAELTVPAAGPEQYMVSARSSEADAEDESYHNDVLLGQLVQRGILTPERAEMIPRLFKKVSICNVRTSVGRTTLANIHPSMTLACSPDPPT